ncbi:MAG: NUDIX domain-containing protein [Alphaproteobacteria bacterium]|nr:NUDIX domain-containing protein [Alphaproteobacteria bacterium]
MSNPRIEAYLRLLDAHPRWLETPSGGLPIITDPSRIATVEQEVGARYQERGMPCSWAEVGVHYRDPYLFVMRDAVVFPDGSQGIHHRTLRSDAEFSGVVALPLYRDGVLLIRHFRHPTRRWHWEFPRGAIETGSSPENAIRQELHEEIEATIEGIEPLGRIHGATGFLGLGVLIFAVCISRFGAPARGEGIDEVRPVSIEAFEDMVRKDEISDSFTLGAFLRGRLLGLV